MENITNVALNIPLSTLLPLDLSDENNSSSLDPTAFVGSPFVLPCNELIVSLEISMEFNITGVAPIPSADTFTFYVYYRSQLNNAGAVGLASAYTPINGAVTSITINNTNASGPGTYSASNKVMIPVPTLLVAGTHLIVVYTRTSPIASVFTSINDEIGITAVVTVQP